MLNRLNSTVNELTAIEVMGWIVSDSTNHSYKDESNNIVDDWNPYENIDHSLRLLAKVRRDGYNWRIEPNKNGAPRVVMLGKDGQELFAVYNLKVSIAICTAVLNHYVPGWYSQFDSEYQV